MPSCLQCGAVVEDLLCDGCFDGSFPPTSEEEASHRSRVRAFLDRGRVLSHEATWRKVRELVEAHLPALTADFSRAVPLALHRSGFFCTTSDTDKRCRRLMHHAPEVARLLARHQVMALGYRMGIGYEAGTQDYEPLSSCTILHPP